MSKGEKKIKGNQLERVIRFFRETDVDVACIALVRVTEIVEERYQAGGKTPAPNPGEYHSLMSSVNHPAHYGGDTTYEAIKVIEAWGLGFCLGNAVKYIARAKKKGSELEDLRKARWYLDREIRRMENEANLSNVGTGKA